MDFNPSGQTLLLTLPQGYAYQHLLSGNPYSYVYTQPNGTQATGKINITNTNYYPSTTSNIPNQVNWKEFVWYANTTATTGTSTTLEALQPAQPLQHHCQINSRWSYQSLATT